MNWMKIFGAVGKWSVRVARVVPVVEEAISFVEIFVQRKGQEKREAAVMLVQTMLEAAETGAGRDLVDDAVVLEKMRAYIDAAVAFKNALAEREAARNG